MRTTRFGNGAEKVRKITVTKPDAMAARKKDRDFRNETLDDLQQNEDERRRIQPLLKANSKAPERSLSWPANVLRRLDERKAVGVESRSCEPLQPRPLGPGPPSPVVFKPCHAKKKPASNADRHAGSRFEVPYANLDLAARGLLVSFWAS